MSKLHRYPCGVPEQFCSGAATDLSTPWSGSHKTHGDPKQARNCRIRYLVEQLGYEKTAKPGELRMPDGTIYVLTKLSKWTTLRNGKAGRFMRETKGHSQGKRGTHGTVNSV